MSPYQPADESDAAVAAFVRHARREAATNPRNASDKLIDKARRCSTQHLNHLSRVVMVRHPNDHACATGAGAVWAIASRLVNEAARAVLPERPLFQLID